MRTRQQLRQTQNFLHDVRLVRRLVRRAALAPTDDVIDIGAGKGILTDALASSAGTVLAVELDSRHVQHLRDRFRDRPNVVVFGADALAFPLPATPYKVFASIPFRWTAAIVAKLTTGTSPSADSWLVVQKEAAERYLAGDTSTMVAIQMYPWFEVSIEHVFTRADFAPRPAVDSVLMRIRQRDEALLPLEGRERFQDMVAAMFSAWKPTAEDALRMLMPRHTFLRLDAGIMNEIRVRPGAVRPDTWVRLYREVKATGGTEFWRAVTRHARQLQEQQESIERPTRTRAHQDRRRT